MERVRVLRTGSLTYELSIANSNVFCDGDSGKARKQSECPKQKVEPTTFRLIFRVPFAMVTRGNSGIVRMLGTRGRIYDLLITRPYAQPLRYDEEGEYYANDDDDVHDDNDDLIRKTETIAVIVFFSFNQSNY